MSADDNIEFNFNATSFVQNWVILDVFILAILYYWSLRQDPRYGAIGRRVDG